MTQKLKKEECKGIFVYIEIKDHERILDGSLEILTKARSLADKLNEKIYAIIFGLEVNQYLDTLKQYGPDYIIYSNRNDLTLKHYHEEIFPSMIEELIKEYKPSILLFSLTEVGTDLSSRLAQRLETGLTAHCSELNIINSEKFGKNLLLMKRPAFSGDMMVSILCPENRPQMATVLQGIIKKEPCQKDNIELIEIECNYELSQLKIQNVTDPTRWLRKSIPLEKAKIIVAGGAGLGSEENFKKTFVLAEDLDGEVGCTRIPYFKKWCDEERMIGQTGKVIHPDLYIGFGISGQIQHTATIYDSKRIISVNTDKDANLNKIADYVIVEDANIFLNKLIERIKKEKKTVC